MILLGTRDETPAWTSTQISWRHPAFWQLQFFLFQFQFLLIFKILISEMYAIIVLQCLAIYLCLLLYARLILSHWSCRRPSIMLLLRCHLCSQAIKLRHFTLSPEEKHTRGGAYLVMKQKVEVGNELLWEEEHKLGGSQIQGRQGAQKHCLVFPLMPRVPSEMSGRETTLND